MVLQDTWLFEGSILETSFVMDLKMQPWMTLKIAAKLAQTDHFIESLPDGYDFMLI
jgi:ATP-binding cassette, subfamily B, multidrug efflux pump